MAVRGQERAILVGVELKSRSRRGADHISYTIEESLEELKVLAESAGAVVEETIIQSRVAPDAATLIGKGKLEQLRNLVAAQELDVVLFDSDLTPTQQRNLERALDCKILDRTQLILDIFARRARTREGQLQVELAQLNYMLPRLTGRGVEMSRLGGGIGTRGPGETQLETDRRRIHSRIKKLSDQLEGVRSGRGVQRHQRQSVPLATVALVGYTNAGKSTLFNRLTGAAVLADARMFATLDPTVRHVELPSRRKVLMSDTVGFIRNLPTTLVKAFRATLEEVVEASLLLHVVDASSSYAPHQTAHVLKVLSEIGADQTRQILVLNKMDLLPDSDEASESL
ncbi:MAG TPA: GTPase HflX, partial [Bryobacteraceae bacterium]|nr:GTPase HflX [Bryobacteraceae bacterium]